MDEKIAAEARMMIYGSWCVYIGRCLPEWERQQCVYGKDQSHILFIEHLLMTHKLYTTGSADANQLTTSPVAYSSHAGDTDRVTIVASAEHQSEAESKVRDRPQDDQCVEWTMDDKQTDEDQSANEVDQEGHAGLIPYFWAQTAPDDDTKDIVSVLQDPTCLDNSYDDSHEYDDEVSPSRPVPDANDSDWAPGTSEDSLSDDHRTRPKTFTPSNPEQKDIHHKRKYVKKRKDNISKQKEKKEPKKENAPKVCPVCAREFENPFRLKQHYRIHTGERPYLCSTCGNSYRTSGELKCHMDRHAGHRYECPDCNKMFTTRPILKVHQRIHTGEKPYVCTDCGKRFKVSGHLRRHALTHTGELPYKCDTCGKGFNQSYNLTVHLRTHTGVVPFPCTVCGKGFKHAFSLRNHMKKHDVHK